MFSVPTYVEAVLCVLRNATFLALGPGELHLLVRLQKFRDLLARPAKMEAAKEPS